MTSPFFRFLGKNFQILGVIFWKILEAKNSIWNYLTFKAKVFFAKSEIKSEQIKDELSGPQPEFEVIIIAWLGVGEYQFMVLKIRMIVASDWPGLVEILIFFEMEEWENDRNSWMQIVKLSISFYYVKNCLEPLHFVKMDPIFISLTLFHFKRSENILLTCSLNGL